MALHNGTCPPNRAGGSLAAVRRLALVFALASATCQVWAKRLHQPLGDYVREAAVIVIADTRRGGEHGWDTILTVTEVLKGDAKLRGQEIVRGKRDLGSQVTERLPGTRRAAWQRLAPLWPLAEQPDEAAFLTERLGAARDLPPMAREWLVTRLGELKDRRAAPVLVNLLAQEKDYGAGVGLGAALAQIGGPQAEEALTKLLAHPDHQVVRARAVEAIFAIQGERVVPLARRMLQEKDFGSPSAALGHLGRFGAPEDIALLAGWCDYWRADRALHYWAMQAIGELRERCGYDLNGPIRKAPADHGPAL